MKHLETSSENLTVSSPAVIFIDLLKFQFCWDVMLYYWLCSSQCFEALQGLHLQGPAVHNPRKCWEPLIWHNITSMKTWTLGSTAVRILNLITQYGCPLLYIIAFELYSEAKSSTEYGCKSFFIRCLDSISSTATKRWLCIINSLSARVPTKMYIPLDYFISTEHF